MARHGHTRSPGRILGRAIFLALLALTVWFGRTLLRERTDRHASRAQGITREDLPPGPPAPGNLRIATWNIRNFPTDERPQAPDLGFSRRTNREDLEAVLAGLGFDVLGVEEIRRPDRFLRLLHDALPSTKFGRAFTRSGGRWGQHVGVVWRRDRLRMVGRPAEIRSVTLGNPDLRPALAVRLRSVREDGIDLLVVQVHLRATRKGFDVRCRQARELARWIRREIARSGDTDVVLQGDFNTTGPEGGDLAAELRKLDRILGAAGLRRLPNATGCSEYWEGPGERDGIQIPSLLDQVYLSGLEERDGSVPLTSWLHCARYDCRPLVSIQGHEDATFWDVSDHCPLTFEVRDRDMDRVTVPCE